MEILLLSWGPWKEYQYTQLISLLIFLSEPHKAIYYMYRKTQSPNYNYI